jgi:predicted RND superfamily exporter protein
MRSLTRLPPFLVVTLFGALAAFALLRVQFSAVLYEMLPADLPEVRGMDWLNRHFGRDGQLVVTVKAGESFEAEAAVASLSARLGDHPELVAEVFRELTIEELVGEGGGLLAWLWLNSPAGTLGGLAARLDEGRSAELLAEAKEEVDEGFFDQDLVIKSYDPLGFARLDELLGDGSGAGADPMTSPDGTFGIFYLEGAGVDFSDYRAAARWLDRIREIVTEWEEEWERDRGAAERVVVGLTGTPAFMGEVGTRMERDMSLSVFATMALISLLFWWMHRQTKPLAWLVSAMLAVLTLTLVIGGSLFGDLGVMSAGFAAILMGLAVDYGIVIYREACDGGGTAAELRRRVGPGILWAAATTAAVFLSLNLSSLPGLSQMGNLVAIGVAVGAMVMLYGFAPVAASFASERGTPLPTPRPLPASGRLPLVAALAVPALALGTMVLQAPPSLEANFHPFRIRDSPSMVAWRSLQEELRGRENAIPTLVTAPDLPGLVARLAEAEGRIEAAKQAGLVEESVLPGTFIPDPDRLFANAASVRNLLAHRDRVLGEIGAAGFSEEGASLAKDVFDCWARYLGEIEHGEIPRPEGRLATWSIDRLYSARDGAFAALAAVRPTNPRERAWVEAVCDESTAVASLGSLGTALNERIRVDLARVFLPMLGVLVVMLALVFRSWRDLLLALLALLFAAAVLVLATSWTPLAWNSFNVCGLPLVFGTGLDYGIHMILALRRNGGDLAATRSGIGRALLFCGGSSAIGFGSLATASAHGLASLGLVCAVGILANMAAAIWLIPHGYRWLHRGRISEVQG